MLIENKQQLMDESQTWKQDINAILDQNIQLKNQLSLWLQHSCEPVEMEKAEYFQNGFVKTDVFAGVLRDEVVAWENAVAPETRDQKRAAIRYNLHLLHQHFENLSAEFEQFLVK
ncbi:hypothetical protein [Flavihumibacter petaseus]|uniref:Uncharacterized protein n=1 Tax=Flavihumibacter petaseus NBRC 106054 TaxID=1220578 RepID=A0A0E9N5T9_9BACT|nr:hypothetical protein [Flavihumibacter petaseus]GAO45168.1 hypothetical protein FPE01S_04_04120 [Flavihumibacter petaseus NBRC 106054]